MSIKIDVLRIVQEPAFAAALTPAQWRMVAADPGWHDLVTEHHEMAAPVMARYSAELGLPLPRPVHAQAAAAAPPAYRVIGKPAARLHGIGIVTDRAQYTHQAPEHR